MNAPAIALDAPITEETTYVWVTYFGEEMLVQRYSADSRRGALGFTHLPVAQPLHAVRDAVRAAGADLGPMVALGSPRTFRADIIR